MNTRPRDKKINYTPPCVRHLWEEGVSEGNRNHSLAALVSHFYQLGHSEDKAYKWAVDWGIDKCVPPLAEKEIEKTVKSIYTQGYSYGCNKLEEVSTCFKECKFYEKRGK